MATATIIDGTDDGMYVVDAPVTPSLLQQCAVSPNIGKYTLDIWDLTIFDKQKIKKIKCSTKEVRHLLMDGAPDSTMLAESVVEGDGVTPGGATPQFVICTEYDDIFSAGDTILVQGVMGYEADGVTPSPKELVLYVTSRDSSTGLKVQAINGKKITGVPNCLPAIEEGTTLIRMGSANVDNGGDTILASSRSFFPSVILENFCQNFFASSQFTDDAISYLGPNYNFNDSIEVLKKDLTTTMEQSYLWGVKNKKWDPVKRDYAYVTGGIWRQAGKQYNYTTSSFDFDKLVSLLQTCFSTGFSKELIMLCGKTWLKTLMNAFISNENDLITITRNTKKSSGDSYILASPWGNIELMWYRLFDYAGHEYDGFVYDPKYLAEYVLSDLNVKVSKNNGVKSAILNKTSCLVVTLPKSAMRIVKR